MPVSSGRLPVKPLLFLILGLVLAGCGGGDDPSAGDRATEAASPTAGASVAGTDGDPASPAAATIGEIVWATEVEPGSNRPVARVDRFAADAATIIAVLPVAGVPAGTIVRASWTYNETSLDTLTASTTVDVSSPEAIWIEFHLDRVGDDPWPDGTYEISIVVGETVRQASVEVVAGE